MLITASVNVLNPGTAFTTEPNPTAALVFIIAMIDPVAPALIDLVKPLYSFILVNMDNIIPDIKARTISHFKRFNVRTTEIKGKIDINGFGRSTTCCSSFVSFFGGSVNTSPLAVSFLSFHIRYA